MTTTGDPSLLLSSPSARGRLPWLSRVNSRRDQLTVLLTLLACGLMILAALDFRSLIPDDSLGEGVKKMALGALAFVAALWLARSPQPATVVATTTALDPPRPRWRLLVPGLVLVALATATSIQPPGIPLLGEVPLLVQFWLWLAGVILSALGLAGAWRPVRVDWKGMAPLLLILVLALILRVVALGESVRVLVDEGHWIDAVMYTQNVPTSGLLTTPSTYLPPTQMFALWETGTIDLFGRTLFGLRLMNALVGTVNVWALYLLVRALFDRPTALAAALLLATFPPHIHFSRLAMVQVADPAFATLAFAFAVRGLRDNRRVDWALCGIGLGMTQYFFEAGRLLFPPLMIAWIGLMAVVMRGHLRAHWRGLVTATAGALIVALPVYAVIVLHNNSFTDRMNDSGLGSTYWRDLLADGINPDERREIVDRFTVPFRSYVNLPDQSLFYVGSDPLILAPFVPLALLGLAYTLWRWRTPVVLLPLWLVATGLGNGLLQNGTLFPRHMVVFPALALLLVLGARSALPLLTPRLPAFARAALFALLIAVVSILQVYYYYNIFVPTFNVQIRAATGYPDAIDAVLRWLALPPQTQIVLISDPQADENVARSMHGFVVDPPPELQLLVYVPAQITPEMLRELPRDRNYAFFVQPGHEATISTLSAAFPLDPPQTTPYDDIPPDRRYILYFSPEGGSLMPAE